MEKKIRTELMKMGAMMLVLAALGIYAHDFVIAGIKAKVALNLTIFATFGIAAWLAFRHVFALNNEVLALKALQVDYGTRNRRPLDPYRKPAVVFHEPELLGHGYRMITEELNKADSLQISNATAQMLLHDVDLRISDRKSTIMYFSGLMVFLGLLGAFMGLMKTVHSVGDLIGSMDVSGGGGTESFGKLIEGMKGPLNGMSVGFSSSLFGLMTSMVLGALERCMASAMKTLRNEFELWLSNVSALEAPEREGKPGAELGGVVRALELGARQIGDLREAVREGHRSAAHTEAELGRMSEAIRSLSEAVGQMADPRPLLTPISDCVTELARNQLAMVRQFDGLITAADADRSAIREALQVLAHRDGRETSGMSDVLARLDTIAARQSEIAGEGSLPLRVEPVRQVVVKPAGLFGRIFSGWGGGHDHKRLRADMRRVIVEHRRFSKQVTERLAEAVSTMEAGRADDHRTVRRMMAQNEHAAARLAVLMDRLQLLDEPVAGEPGDGALIADLHGARLEMDVLRRRLDGAVGQEPAPRVGSARG